MKKQLKKKENNRFKKIKREIRNHVIKKIIQKKKKSRDARLGSE